MLILTRKVFEEICIEVPGGEVIRVSVAQIKGKQARLGISAPRSFPVHRGEVWEVIEKTRLLAASKSDKGETNGQ